MKAHRVVSIFLVLVLLMAAVPSMMVAAAGTVTVHASDVGVSWFTADTRSGGASSFVMGPGTAPQGLGSLQMTTTDVSGSSNAKAQLFNDGFIGAKLSDLDGLSYWAYRSSTSTNSNAQTISLNLEVDYKGDGYSYTTLVFEPVYQSGGVGAMLTDTWQQWDAYNSGNAIWWSTKSIPGVPQAFTSYVSWNTIIANNPNAVIKGGLGFNVGSGWAGQFQGAADELQVSFAGNATTYDFEPDPPCTTVCYADAVHGNDANSGTSMAKAKKTIQAAIDAVDPNGDVHILPGNYSETATNRFVLGTNGPHQFGLFIAKDGVTLQGVDASDTPITDYNALQAYITTNATNNFGYSGVFVQGDHVTLAGLHIGPNAPSDNKTIEVIGDGFTLKDSHIDVSGGSVYFDDWRFDTVNDVSHLQTYTIDHNLLDQSTSLDFSSGAGYSGDPSGRQIIQNEFKNQDYWPSISFNGSGTGVPWFVQSVGGAVIKDNSFTNTFNGTNVTAGHIRVRGSVNDSEFDWTSYWKDNNFNKAVVTLVGAYPPFAVRQYNYTSGSYSFDVRRIGVNIQSGIDTANAGDTVLVRDGTYPESPTVNKSLTLTSWKGRDVTTIQLQSGPTYLGSLTINGSDVTVNGFTIVGFDGTPSTLASSNVYLTSVPSLVTITNNRFKVGAIDTASSNGDDGMGVLTTYNTSADVDSLEVTGNTFEPLNAAGTRAFFVNPGVNHFRFFQNGISGNFLRTAITQAKDGLVDENVVTGTGPAGSRSAGLGTWGYPDPTVYGHTTFKNNTIQGVGKGIAVFATNDVNVTNNFFTNNDVAVWVGDSSNLSFDPTTIAVHENSIEQSSLFGAQNSSALTGQINAETNWWNSADGPQPTGSGDKVSSNVDYTPWLCVNVDTSPDPGYQPLIKTDCAGPMASGVIANPNPAAISSSMMITAKIDDSTTGGSNIASADYSLDGGTTWAPMVASDGTFDEVSENVQVAVQAPGTPGIYNLCVRGTDAAANPGTPACILFVTYDPNGGFVTGGGWINSPVNANYPYMSVGGQATFGFVSKYNKGASVPDGNTQFQFKAGNLNFNSTSYDWLVINQSGTNAQFKGSGTINGAVAPNNQPYKFMLWAGDGTGPNGADTFRIQIWYEVGSNETVVYDNGTNQPIGGGSIVVHKK